MNKACLRFAVGIRLSASLAACGLFETRERVVGKIASFSEQDAITTPAVVQRGKAFEVTVITAGGGCMEQGETEVEVKGLRADVTPYDYKITPPAGVVCLLYGEDYLHTTTLSFAEKGTAKTLFHGDDRQGEGRNDRNTDSRGTLNLTSLPDMLRALFCYTFAHEISKAGKRSRCAYACGLCGVAKR